MSDSSQKTSIELIDAIESILQHKSCALSLDYLALKLQKKYTMKSPLTRPTFVTIVHNEIEKYPHRILPIENDMYILAELFRQERSTLILPDSEPHPGAETGRSETALAPGCEEELEIHRLTQEVTLLRELNAGCLAWNHSLAVLVKERRRELEEVNTDVNLLLDSYHASKANGNKPNNTLHKKKYSNKHTKGRLSAPGSGKKYKKRNVSEILSERKHKLKTISIKKSKLKLSSKHLTISSYPLPIASSPSSQCSFLSEHNSQTSPSDHVLPDTRPSQSPPAPPSRPIEETGAQLLPIFGDRSTDSNFDREQEQITSSDTD